MLRHTAECRELGIGLAADPSQQLARLERDEVRALIDHSDMLFTNEYESVLLQERSGWTEQQVLGRTRLWITTLGAAGSRVRRAGSRTLEVPAVPAATVADPTGVGDAFRAGFLAGMAWGTDVERAAQLGSALATTALETVGTQEYEPERDDLLFRLAETYGPAAADGMAEHLSRAL